MLVGQRNGAWLAVAGVFDRIQASGHPVVFELEPGPRGAAILRHAEDRRESARLDQLDQACASGAGTSRLGERDGAFEERQLRGEVLAVEAVSQRTLAQRIDDPGGLGICVQGEVRLPERVERTTPPPLQLPGKIEIRELLQVLDSVLDELERLGRQFDSELHVGLDDPQCRPPRTQRSAVELRRDARQPIPRRLEPAARGVDGRELVLDGGSGSAQRPIRFLKHLREEASGFVVLPE